MTTETVVLSVIIGIAVLALVNVAMMTVVLVLDLWDERHPH